VRSLLSIFQITFPRDKRPRRRREGGRERGGRGREKKEKDTLEPSSRNISGISSMLTSRTEEEQKGKGGGEGKKEERVLTIRPNPSSTNRGEREGRKGLLKEGERGTLSCADLIRLSSIEKDFKKNEKKPRGKKGAANLLPAYFLNRAISSLIGEKEGGREGKKGKGLLRKKRGLPAEPDILSAI